MLRTKKIKRVERKLIQAVRVLARKQRMAEDAAGQEKPLHTTPQGRASLERALLAAEAAIRPFTSKYHASKATGRKQYILRAYDDGDLLSLQIGLGAMYEEIVTIAPVGVEWARIEAAHNIVVNAGLPYINTATGSSAARDKARNDINLHYRKKYKLWEGNEQEIWKLACAHPSLDGDEIYALFMFHRKKTAGKKAKRKGA